jgi:hypothetical protein
MFLPLFVAPSAVTNVAPAQTDPSASTPRDPTTGQPIPLVDETGQPIVPKDDTGQTIVPKDETGQILPLPPGTPVPLTPDTLLPTKALGNDLDPATTALRLRGAGTAYRLHVELIEGYNSNVVQTIGPTTPHPALFTGLDVGVDLLTATSTDLQVFRLVARGQYYASLDGYPEPYDGTVAGSFTRTITLSPRTFLSTVVLGTITSSNSALIADGPVLVPNPSSLTTVYAIGSARLGFSHELGPRWRLLGGLDTTFEEILSGPAYQTSGGATVSPDGLDDINPGIDATLAHDIDPYNTGMLMLRYQLVYVPTVVDYATNPPTASGASVDHSVLATLGWNHAFTEHLRSTISAGATLTSAPPLDPDRNFVLSPTATLVVTYLRSYWNAILSASYAYGSLDPRLGFGPGEAAGFTLQGIPYPHGSWNRLAVLVNGVADHAEYVQEVGDVAKLTYTGATAELRYGVNDWLGLVLGYDLLYTRFDGTGAYPPLLRNIAFLGVSGYFANDRSLPLLTTFVSPVAPL